MFKPTGPESYIYLLFYKMPNRPKVRLINQNERKISWSVLILEKLTRSHLEKLFSTVTDVKETKDKLVLFDAITGKLASFL